MAYCTNCGSQQIENAKFCHNCGNSFDTKLADVHNQIPENKLEDFSQVDYIDRFDFEMYFRHLVGKERIFLWDNFPKDKLESFQGFFNPVIIKNSNFYVYYDDTEFGKENEGFAIVYCDDDIYFLFKTIEDGTFGVFLRNIRRVEFVEKFGIVCTIKLSEEGEEDEETGFTYKPKSSAVLMSLFNFLNHYANLYGDYTASEDENNAILSMMNWGDDDEEDEDNKKGDGAGIR
jgi:hypothetical protein